jgi:hypothetical protein
MELGDKEVLEAFDWLTQERLVSEQYRICFFIDGFDEFDESHGYTCYDLTLKLKKWADISAGHIKFCVSTFLAECCLYLTAHSMRANEFPFRSSPRGTSSS